MTSPVLKKLGRFVKIKNRIQSFANELCSPTTILQSFPGIMHQRLGFLASTAKTLDLLINSRLTFDLDVHYNKTKMGSQCRIMSIFGPLASRNEANPSKGKKKMARHVSLSSHKPTSVLPCIKWKAGL